MDIHTISIGVVNRYLVHDQGWILVDTGIPHTQGRVARTIDRLGIRPTDIRLIVLTHGHVDHAGSAQALQRLTGARIAIHHQDQTLLEQGLVVVPPVWTQPGRALGAMLNRVVGLWHFPPASADIVVGDEGLSLSEYGIRGRIVHTPGHSPGSISIVLDTGEALVGDLVGGVSGSRGRPRLPPAGNNPQQLVTSLRMLLDQGVHTVYSGHGHSFPAELARTALP